MAAGLLPAACASSPSAGVPEADTSKVTIVFVDAPDQSALKLLKGSRVPIETVNYVSSDTLNVQYVPRSVGNDTLTVPTFGGYTELWHRYAGMDERLWLLKGGDTVCVNYSDDGRPALRSLTNDANTRLYNLPWQDERALHAPSGYSLKCILGSSELAYIHKRFSSSRGSLPAEVIEAYGSAYLNLDSLRQVYNAYRSDLGKSIDSLTATGELTLHYAGWLRKQFLEGEYTTDEVLRCDSLLTYPSACRALLGYRTTAMKQSTRLFDAVASDSTLSHAARRNLLRSAILYIRNSDFWTSYPERVIREYTDRYIAFTGDSSLQVMQVEKPNVATSEGYTYDLALLSLDGHQTNLADVLARHKGKVVYADLWASWCAPCKAEMPEAVKLREANREKDVVFLYIAVGDSEQPWQREARAQRTDHLAESYFVLNNDDARFLKEINHRLIPRHLLFDRQGRLVDANAPRAAEAEVQEAIERYLKK